MPYTLFLDESGHAGANYLDSEQPFHVVAGIMVADKHLPDFRRAVKNVLTNVTGGEIKGSQMMRSAKGQQRAYKALKAIAAARAIPVITMMERRYALMLKIVDVFLDPAYLDNLTWLPIGDPQRADIAESLAKKLPETVIQEFAKAYRAPTIEGFEAVLNGILDAIDDDPRLRRSLEDAKNSLSTIVPAETYDGGAGGQHTDLIGLNVPAFCHTVRTADRLVEPLSEKFRVIHDETRQFEQLFRQTLASLTYMGPANIDVRMPDGNVIRSLVRHCVGFDVVDSKDEIGVRAADVLASCTARVLRALDAPWGESLRELARMTLPLLLVEHPDGGQMSVQPLVSEATKEKILGRMVNELVHEPAT